MYDMLKSMSSLRSSEAGGSSVSSRMRKFLSQRKDYLQTGYVAYDETVLSYIRKLDEHRRKCEATGKYQEAKATMARLAELKTAQAEQMRLGLVQNQAGELQEIERVFEEETTKFNKYWEQRIAMYELGFKKHLELMQASHDTALDNLCNDLEASRPSQAKPSSAYLSLRERERVLIKSRLYDEAEALKTTTDMLYSAELDQTIAEYDAQAQLKVARLQTKQQHDLEALLQRGSMGRDELELKRQQQEQRRRNRLRAVISELESLHKLEVVQLECFLDGQALAGKAVPLADGYHRKREIIYTNFARELEL